eukprot:3085245-Rhodomonas_salina.1
MSAPHHLCFPPLLRRLHPRSMHHPSDARRPPQSCLQKNCSVRRLRSAARSAARSLTRHGLGGRRTRLLVAREGVWTASHPGAR